MSEDYDQRLKTLLREFAGEFFDLFFPIRRVAAWGGSDYGRHLLTECLEKYAPGCQRERKSGSRACSTPGSPKGRRIS